MFGPIEFILAGVLVGFCVGITGVGGGSLMTPILISLFKIEPHIAIGTDLLYASISKFCGSVVHAKKLKQHYLCVFPKVCPKKLQFEWYCTTL